MKSPTDKNSINFRSLFDASPTATLIVDPDGEVSFANLAAATLLGFTKPQIYAQPIIPLLASLQNPDILHLGKRLLAQGRMVGDVEAPVVNHLGMQFDCRVSCQPLHASCKASERPFHALYLFSNLDAHLPADGRMIACGGKQVLANQENLEAALIHASEAAEAASQAKEALLEALTHEIRTPLAAILGALELMETDADHSRENLQIVLRNCARLRQWIESLEEAAAPSPPATVEAVRIEDAPLENLNLLVVEDCPDLNRLTSIFLQRAGAFLDCAYTGLEAIKKSRAKDYDLILMDIQMPEMDGFEATRYLRENGYRNPILIVTAHTPHGHRDRCMTLGCDDYLTKPVDYKKLISRIRELAAH